MRELPEGWSETTLGSKCLKIGSGSTPRGGNEVYKKEGISLIRSQNILDFIFSYKGLAFIDELQASKLSNVEVFENDILINITGDSVARVCKVPKEVLPARVNQHVAILRTIKEELNSNYLKYYLLNPVFKKYLLILANSGGTRNALTKNMLEMLELNLSSPIEQESIAEILSSFDEKIELLREENKILETVAQTIYKEWFVNFNYPNASGEMMDSELGEIPKGWQVLSLFDIFELIGGGTPNTGVKEYWGGDLPWYSVTDTPNGSNCFVINTEKNISEEGLENSSTKLLRKGTTIVSARGTVGKLALVGRKMAMNQSCYGINGKAGFGDYFVYFQMNEMINHIKKNVHGAVFDTITKVTFEYIKIPIPTHLELDKFERVVTPVMDKVLNNVHQIQTLSKARDALLPKLMSGEIRAEGFDC